MSLLDGARARARAFERPRIMKSSAIFLKKKKMCVFGSTNACIIIILTLSKRRTSNQQGGLQDSAQRELWYQRSLNLWNQDDTIRDHVVAVENSDGHYDVPNLELIKFNHSRHHENKFCTRPTRAMGEHELISLHQGLASAKRMQGASHVLKITGRYYIPGIAHMLRNISHAHEIIHMHGYAGGCQIMGCRLDACRALWKCPYERYSHCEATIRTRMHAYDASRRFELPRLHTAYTISGSAGTPVTELAG